MGDRSAGARIEEVEPRIVAARGPDRAAVALLRRQAVPARVTGRAGLRNRFGTPDLGAGLGVECNDEAATGARIGAAGNASNDFVARRQWSTGEGVALPVVGDRRVPDHFAGVHVERDDVRICRGQEHLVVV